MSDMVIELIGGNCPVQAEGKIGGKPFYFRARGERWSLSIASEGGDPVGDPDWHLEVRYHPPENIDSQFAAGWMTETEARTFLELGAALWRAATA